MLNEIVIIGFPKCGTSALMRCFEQDPSMQVRRAPSGGMELSWPLIRDTPPEMERDPDKIQAHKYTAYAYNSGALDYLVKVNPDSILALCVRDPARALVSWHHMHQSIARSGKNKEHFAWKERDFHAESTVSEYYEEFAKPRLQYDVHLKAMLEIVPRARLAVVSQERIAQNIDAVAGYLKALSMDKSVQPPVQDGEQTTVHRGYADKTVVELDPKIERELQGVQRRLYKVLDKETMHKCL